MRDQKLMLSMVDFLDITECNIYKGANEHGYLRISGHIDGSKEAALFQEASSQRSASLTFLDENGESQVIFTGIVESVLVKAEAGVKKATVVLTGATKLLDLTEHTRVYEGGGSAAMSNIKGNYTGMQYIMGASELSSVGNFIVQYKETDWEFIKRMAFQCGHSILPYYKSDGIKFFLGSYGNGKLHKIEPVTYSIENGTEEFFYKQKNGVTSLYQEDAYYYSFDSREFFDLGDAVTFQNKILYVYQVESEWKGSELIHHYRLKTEGGFKQCKSYNTKIIGASLDATVSAVSADKVKVTIHIGGESVGCSRFFSYSTVYSSPDGTGWYCMPEVNDRVRLYFPNEQEGDAYVISSIHVGSEAGSGAEVSGSRTAAAGNTPASGGSPRSNPDNKSLMNKYKKQIELTPTSIVVTNNNGMTIKLDDNEGISIISKKDIIIESEENLDISSLQESMTMEAAESLTLLQGDTKIILKDDVIVEGAMLKVQ